MPRPPELRAHVRRIGGSADGIFAEAKQRTGQGLKRLETAKSPTSPRLRTSEIAA